MFSTTSFTMKKIFLALAVFAALAQNAMAANEATRARILLVIDTDTEGAKDFGATHDRDHMRSALEKHLKHDHLKYTLDILQGSSVTKDKILNYYKNLKTNSNETLFFYYTGHGGMSAKYGQFLALHRGTLWRSELRAAMMAHSPRLAVILTDCCSSGIASNVKLPSEGTAPKWITNPGKLQPTGNPIRDLLYRHEGLVVIGAAKQGTTASGNKKDGSYMTSAFVHLLDKAPGTFGPAKKDGFVEWAEMFNSLRPETQRLSGKDKQTPQFFFLES